MASVTISNILEAEIETAETGLSLWGQLAGLHPRKEGTPGWLLQPTHNLMRTLIDLRESLVVALLRHERYSWPAIAELMAGKQEAERSRQSMHQQYATRVEAILTRLEDLTPGGRKEAVEWAAREQQLYLIAITGLTQLDEESGGLLDPDKVIEVASSVLASVIRARDSDKGSEGWPTGTTPIP